MTPFDPKPLITQLFAQLRQQGVKLGIGEYLAALQAMEGGFGDRPEQLKQTLRLLWCHTILEQHKFDEIWQELLTQSPQKTITQTVEVSADLQLQTLEQIESIQFAPGRQIIDRSQVQSTTQQVAPLPVRAPLRLVEADNLPELQTYYPISQRAMIYSWRYLRRLVASGSPDVVDIPSTVEQVARQGFFLAPVYQRRERNEARLLLLVDQNGSMMPFHRFTRDLVETALMDNSFQEDYVIAVYFQNVPRAYLYRDPYLTQPIPLEAALSWCDQDTSALIVSDAGAARGHRQLERIQATTEFLFHLRQRTSLIAWLNPMPETRWVGSSAEILEKLVPMRQMDQDGLSQVIDIIRGQALHHYRFPLL